MADLKKTWLRDQILIKYSGNDYCMTAMGILKYLQKVGTCGHKANKWLPIAFVK